jgi:hypothetical protein
LVEEARREDEEQELELELPAVSPARAHVLAISYGTLLLTLEALPSKNVRMSVQHTCLA